METYSLIANHLDVFQALPSFSKIKALRDDWLSVLMRTYTWKVGEAVSHRKATREEEIPRIYKWDDLLGQKKTNNNISQIPM